LLFFTQGKFFALSRIFINTPKILDISRKFPGGPKMIFESFSFILAVEIFL
jgi:hypothetical protein